MSIKRACGYAPFHADRAGYHVHSDAVPAWVCGQCGEALFDAREVDAIQASLSSLDAHALQLLFPDPGGD